MHLIINSEGDMESGIETATRLAKKEDSSLTLEFPSEEFAKLFIDNMFVSFVDNKIPKQSKMKLNVIFPTEEEFDEEEGFEFGS
jgi:hypothetical protein|tara:strand:+ start:349 stop:600 length:252 start_codon:yes stop_codon:yes gene_type:complete